MFREYTRAAESAWGVFVRAVSDAAKTRHPDGFGAAVQHRISRVSDEIRMTANGRFHDRCKPWANSQVRRLGPVFRLPFVHPVDVDAHSDCHVSQVLPLWGIQRQS